MHKLGLVAVYYFILYPRFKEMYVDFDLNFDPTWIYILCGLILCFSLINLILGGVLMWGKVKSGEIFSLGIIFSIVSLLTTGLFTGGFIFILLLPVYDSISYSFNPFV